LDFQPVTVVGKIVHKQKINNYVHGEKQYTNSTEHTKQKAAQTKQEDIHTTIKLKNIKHLIRK